MIRARNRLDSNLVSVRILTFLDTDRLEVNTHFIHRGDILREELWVGLKLRVSNALEGNNLQKETCYRFWGRL